MAPHFMTAALRRVCRPRNTTQSHARAISPPMFLRRLAGACALGVVALVAACDDIELSFGQEQDPVVRPYHIEPVYFAGGPGVTLAGELTMPSTGGPFKAAILISGSGPQDRNEEIAGHKPFLVLSDHLTKAGYAVLRYDDRGFAESSGSYQTADLNDFANDAAGAFRYLQSRPEIDPRNIGFIGHSEGGRIGPAAGRMVDPAFMVLLAGPARPLLPDVLATQTADVLRAEGASEANIQMAVRQVEQGSALLARPVPLPHIRQEMDQYLTAQGIEHGERQEILNLFATRWGVGYANDVPVRDLRALSIPVLALFGENDLQVSAKEEVPVMRSALRHPQSQVQVIDGVNHLFQPSETGLPSEYGAIETTVSPWVLTRISIWMGSL